MVKYGKEFRKIQKKEWKEKYFNYKLFKQTIKSILTGNQTLIIEDKDTINSQNLSQSNLSQDRRARKAAKIKQFIDTLDVEMKKVFIFFTNEEKKLYVNINSHLHQKEDYPVLELNEYLKEFHELEILSYQSYELSQFVFYNLKALLKILKKFDKKIPKNPKRKIFHNYVQVKLEEQNSDILYMLKFKMIDEVCALLEELQSNLKFNYDKSKNLLKIEENKPGSLLEIEDFDAQNLTTSKAHSKINEYYNLITRNVKRVDKLNYDVKVLFKPWDNFLKISSQITSKLYAITKESTVGNENIELDKKEEEANLDDTFGNTLADNTNILPNSSQMGSLSILYKKNSSIVSNIFFSRENAINITITLIHTFAYMFSFSITIPPNIKYIKDLFYPDYYSGFLNMLLPLGVLLSFSYTTIWSSKSTKFSLIFSTFILFVGNVLYSIAFELNNIYFLFVGRFLVGLGSNRVSNKMYLANFIPIQKLNKYLSYFHILSVLGLSCGFFVNSLIESKQESLSSSDSHLFTKNTYGTWICSGFFLLLLISEILGLTEAHSENFSTTNTTLDGSKNIISRGTLGVGEMDDPKIKNENVNMTLDESIRRDTIMIEDIDNKLAQFNEENQYSDTNLVSKSISEIAQKEQKHLNFLRGPFLVFITIIFTSKVINELMFVFTPIYILEENPNFSQILLSSLLGLSTFSVLIIELILFNRKKCIPDRPFLLIIIFLCFLFSLLCMNWWHTSQIEYLVFMVILILLSTFLEKFSSSFFAKIIPSNYKACGIQGNMILNIFTNIGRMIGAAIISSKGFVRLSIFDVVVFSFLGVLCLICFILGLIFYGDLRIKAISRILEKERKKSIQIPIEI